MLELSHKTDHLQARFLLLRYRVLAMLVPIVVVGVSTAEVADSLGADHIASHVLRLVQRHCFGRLRGSGRRNREICVKTCLRLAVVLF